jgi:hypothetical protein
VVGAVILADSVSAGGSRPFDRWVLSSAASALILAGLLLANLVRRRTGPDRRLPLALRTKAFDLPPVKPGHLERLVTVILEDGRRVERVVILPGGYTTPGRGESRFDAREAVDIAATEPQAPLP